MVKEFWTIIANVNVFSFLEEEKKTEIFKTKHSKDLNQYQYRLEKPVGFFCNAKHHIMRLTSTHLKHYMVIMFFSHVSVKLRKSRYFYHIQYNMHINIVVWITKCQQTSEV